MSGYAVFSLKFPSLLQFDTNISEKVTRHKIHLTDEDEDEDARFQS
jgi:hypothetical protein